jgi:hypothetical protein
LTSHASASSSNGISSRAAGLWWPVALVLVGIAGIAFRVFAYRAMIGIPNSDEAVLGLMARHVLHGDFTAFVWGQAYGGPQEIYLAVPGFLLFGSSWLALRVAPLAIFLATLYLVWRIGLRTIGRRQAGAAVVLFWVWPAFAIVELAHETSFYAADLFYCALLILLALQIVEQPDRLRVGLFGLVLGLAFWETAQIVPIAIPVVAWTVWKQPKCLRHVWIAVPLALLGALPWIVWNATHGWASLHLRSGPDVPYAHRLRLFFSPVMPMMLGLRVPGTQKPMLPAPMLYLIYAVVLVLFLYGAWRTRHRTVSILYLVAAVYPFVYALAAQTFDAVAPRYVFVLTPVIVLLAAQLATSRVRGAVLVALGCVVTVAMLHRMNQVIDPIPHAPRNIKPLIATLDRLHVTRAYADLWAAYVIAFDSNERIIAVENKFNVVTFPNGLAVLPDDPVVHSKPYERKVRDDPRHAFVFFRKTVGSVPIVPALERHGYRRVLVGPFYVLVPPAAVNSSNG